MAVIVKQSTSINVSNVTVIAKYNVLRVKFKAYSI